MTEHREQAAARILEEAGIVTHPDGSERAATDEPHPFDREDSGAGSDADGSGSGSQLPAEPGTQSDDDESTASTDTQGESATGEDQEPPGGTDEPGSDGSDEDGESEGEADGEQGELDLSSLAETLEISVDELYKLEIPLGADQGSFTLGDVKDNWRDLESLDSAREILDQDKTSSENEKLVARQELQTVVALLGDSISPQLVEHARRQLQSEIVRERELTFQAIPEWQDHETAQRERTVINKFLRGYGFSDAELAQVYDHRLLKLARDSQRNQGKLLTAAEQATPRRSTPGKPGRKPGASALRRARKRKLIDNAVAGGPDQKLAAVGSLLAGD